jgi:hypothetical protein
MSRLKMDSKRTDICQNCGHHCPIKSPIDLLIICKNPKSEHYQHILNWEHPICENAWLQKE